MTFFICPTPHLPPINIVPLDPKKGKPWMNMRAKAPKKKRGKK